MFPSPRSFHFARLYHGDQLDKALARHEHYLFSRLRLKSGMRVLDIGCGTGQVALELASFYNVQVVGIDKSIKMIQEASRLSQFRLMSDQVTFLHIPRISDLQDHPELGIFDAIYAIESLVSESSFEGVYRQCHDLLKPFGVFGVYEWCWTSDFNTSNVEHCQLARILEESTGIGHREPTDRLIYTVMKALERSRFHVLEWEDLAKFDGKTSCVPWYKPLEDAIQSPHLEWPLPQAFGDLSKESATILLHAGVYNLFTPMAMVIARRGGLNYSIN